MTWGVARRPPQDGTGHQKDRVTRGVNNTRRTEVFAYCPSQGGSWSEL